MCERASKKILKGEMGHFENDGFHCQKPFGKVPDRRITDRTRTLYLDGESIGRTVFFDDHKENVKIKERLFIRQNGKKYDISRFFSSVILRPDRSIYVCDTTRGKVKVSIFADPTLPVKTVKIEHPFENEVFSYLAEPPMGYIRLPLKDGYSFFSPFSESAYFVIGIKEKGSVTFLFGRYPRKNPRLIAFLRKKHEGRFEGASEDYRIEKDLYPFRCVIPDKKAQIMINSYLPPLALSLSSKGSNQGSLSHTLSLYCSLFYDPSICRRSLLSLAYNRLDHKSDPLSLPFLLSCYVFMTGDYALTLAKVPYKNSGGKDLPSESLYYHAYRSLTEKSEKLSSSPLFFMKERIFRLFSDLCKAVGSEKERHPLSLVLSSLEEKKDPLCNPVLAEVQSYEGIVSLLSEKLCESDVPIILFGVMDSLFAVRIIPDKGAVCSSDSPFFAKILRECKKYEKDGRISSSADY